MHLNSDDFLALVRRANFAPSVHNTQPTRWRLEPDGSVGVFEDSTRRLHVADAAGRDAAVSHGSAIEGFSLACARAGNAVDVHAPNGLTQAGLRPVARVVLRPGAEPEPLDAYVEQRRSYRGAFVKRADPIDARPLLANGDVTLVDAPTGIARLAELHDEGALKTYRDPAYRSELRTWLRLSKRDPRYALDGLNAEAMEMSDVQAAAAGVILAPRIFEGLDAVKIARALVAEAAIIRSAQTIVLFHRPEEEDPLQTGRRFYRLWLEFARLGLSAAPMSVLADDVDISAVIANQFELPSGRRLINAFRLGVPPPGTERPKTRLDQAALVI